MKLATSFLPPTHVFWSVAKSRSGDLLIGLTKKKEICLVSFLPGEGKGKTIEGWQKQWPTTRFQQSPKTKRDVKAFSRLPVFLTGTPFQQAVWKRIAEIPYGQTETYGSIARCLAMRDACRAVGRACGANPVPYFVPCHRVVGVNGLGGYSGGLKVKKALLKMEHNSANSPG
jgi:O-6-methylguanine DNA methyltransferase